MSGTLVVKVYGGVLLRDTAFMGKMNTQCKITCGGEQKSTEVDKNSGKTPHWHGQNLTFHITNIDTEMDVAIWNPGKDKEAVCDAKYFL
jgi:hypothetical protein